MGDWADNAIRKLEQRRQEMLLESQDFVEKQNIKRAGGVPLWNGLRTEIRNRISELREKADSDVIGIERDHLNDMVLRNQVDGKGQKLYIEFNPEAGKLSWKHGDREQSGWDLVIDKSGQAKFAYAYTVPIENDEVATQILNKLLDI